MVLSGKPSILGGGGGVFVAIEGSDGGCIWAVVGYEGWFVMWVWGSR